MRGAGLLLDIRSIPSRMSRSASRRTLCAATVAVARGSVRWGWLPAQVFCLPTRSACQYHTKALPGHTCARSRSARGAGSTGAFSRRRDSPALTVATVALPERPLAVGTEYGSIHGARSAAPNAPRGNG